MSKLKSTLSITVFHAPVFCSLIFEREEALSYCLFFYFKKLWLKYITKLTFFNPHPRTLIDFREEEAGQREREREREIHVGEKH